MKTQPALTSNLSLTKLSLTAGATLLALSSFGFGATIIENFMYVNETDPGTNAPLTNYGAAGGGWAGGWFSGDSRAYHRPGDNLTYTATGYNNSGNGQGLAADGTGNAGHPSFRTFSTALSGTIWVSALVSTQSEVRLYLPSNTTNSNFIGLFSEDARLQLNGNVTNTTGDDYVHGTTHLFLARVMIGTGDDTIDFWVDPTLTGGEAGLGTPTLSQTGAMGATLTGVGVSFHQGADKLDAIRVSDDPNGFLQVTAIPEPSTALLTGLASLSFLLVRRRK